MTTTTQAKRALHNHGKKASNWRFRALLLAGLPNSGYRASDIAKAWPKNKSDYRFLSQNRTADVDAEMEKRVLAERGSDKHRMLTDYADTSDLDAPKHLAGSAVEQLDDNGLVGARVDDAIPRMLFAADSTEELDVLFREELRDVVADGAMSAQIMREASFVHTADKESGTWSVAQDDNVAPPVGRGSEIPDDREQYAPINWRTNKYALGSRVEDEMVDQVNIDAIERQMTYLGRAVENSINRVALRTLVDDAGTTVQRDSTLDDPTYQVLNEAVGKVDEETFNANTRLTNAAFRTALFQDKGIRYANQAGTDDALRSREFDPILDLDHYAADANIYDDNDSPRWESPGNTFDFANTGDVGAVVYDSDRLITVLYAPNGNDIEMKEYDDPIRDLTGMNARIHCTAFYEQERASAAITHE